MSALPGRRARLALFVAACACTLGTGCPQSSGQQDFSTLPAITTTDVAAEADLRAARDAAEAGRVSEARQRYERFLEEHPRDPLVPVARLGLGRVLLANGEVEPALARFAEVAASDDPRVAEAGRFYRGVALHLAGRNDEALALLQPLIGRTANPEETSLLLRTVASAAQRTGRVVVALAALDRLAGNLDLPEAEREQGRQEVRARVAEADAAAIDAAYQELPRDGAAWPEVAQRAMRMAFDAGDMARVSEIVTELRTRQIPMSDELAQLALRAERTEHADARVIGAIVPLTGRAREVGQRAMRGLLFASGAPAGAPPAADAPQVVFRDDASEPDRAARAVEELVAVHRAIAIVGPLEGESARAAARRAQELGVPLIAIVPDPSVVGAGDMVFRLLAGPREEASALVSAARARGATRFAILRPTHAYGERMSTALARAVVESGGQVVATETYDPSATAFGEVVRRLSAQRFDALFVPDTARALNLIAPALASAGLWSATPGQAPPRNARPVLLLAPSVAADVRATRASSRYLQGALFATPFHAPQATGEARAFVDAFTQRFGEAPDAFAASTYDAFRLIRAGVAAGHTTRAGLGRWLREQGRIETVGASGGVAPDRGPARGSHVLELRGEQLVEPSAVRPASG
jgi:ABC-type branched-subunit amino acid transport system substrate-binding protein/predicted negative regulator of RcsB-dependent stress response